MKLSKSFSGVVMFLAIGMVAGLGGFAQPVLNELAPDIELPDQQGNTFALASLRGKMVLVDFWASWCGPCRVTNKNMKPVYEKYREAGFEIFAVSIDDDLKAWKKAIAADKISWKQVNQQGGWGAPIAKKWAIEQLPTSFLLDKEGKVLAIDPSHDQLNQLLATYLK